MLPLCVFDVGGSDWSPGEVAWIPGFSLDISPEQGRAPRMFVSFFKLNLTREDLCHGDRYGCMRSQRGDPSAIRPPFQSVSAAMWARRLPVSKELLRVPSRLLLRAYRPCLHVARHPGWPSVSGRGIKIYQMVPRLCRVQRGPCRVTSPARGSDRYPSKFFVSGFYEEEEASSSRCSRDGFISAFDAHVFCINPKRA